MRSTYTQPLTQLPFTGEDHEIAKRAAAALGYEQTAYTSTSALWGLFCLPENPRRNPQSRPTVGGCLIKTRELGMMFVQTLEDLHLNEKGHRS